MPDQNQNSNPKDTPATPNPVPPPTGGSAGGPPAKPAFNPMAPPPAAPTAPVIPKPGAPSTPLPVAPKPTAPPTPPIEASKANLTPAAPKSAPGPTFSSSPLPPKPTPPPSPLGGPLPPLKPSVGNPPLGGTPPTPTLPPAPPSPVGGAAVSAVAIQKSPFRFLIPALGVGIVILVAVFLFQRFVKPHGSTPAPAGSAAPTQTTVTYWGLWEPTLIMQDVIAQFEAQNPDIKINYQQQSIKDYRERLQNALQSGTGPDLYRFHVSWTPLFTNDLTPIPAAVLSPQDFDQQQYPVAQAWLKSSKGYLGLPLMMDGLGLYYNQSVLEAAGKTVPKTWEELQRLAIELTIPDKKAGTGRLLRGGLALGTTTNVDDWSDILGWLILQNGSNPAKPDNKLGQDAINFYTSFVKPARTNEQTWDDSLPSSTVAFATEKAVMMIAPSWRAFEVKDMNPNLKFGIAPLPQFPEDQVSWASFWVEGVSSHADKTKQAAAWKFLTYLYQKETLRDLYAAASKQRLFGEIFARTDMADQLKTDPYAGAFVTQSPYAKTWFLNSRTFDNGPNDKIIKYYEDAVNAVLAGSTSDKVTPTIQQGVTQVVSQYRLPATVPTAK